MDSEDEPLRRQQTPDFDTSQAPAVDTLHDLHQAETNRGKRRIATVYDAVAGEFLFFHNSACERRNADAALQADSHITTT